MGSVFSSPKMPADEETRSRPIPWARAASSTVSVPRTLISESVGGWSIERVLPTLAARWKTTPQPAMACSTASLSRTSPSTKGMPGTRFSRKPLDRLSNTTGSWPSATSRSTTLEPMNPGPAGDQNSHDAHLMRTMSGFASTSSDCSALGSSRSLHVPPRTLSRQTPLPAAGQPSPARPERSQPSDPGSWKAVVPFAPTICLLTKTAVLLYTENVTCRIPIRPLPHCCTAVLSFWF